MPYRIKVFNKIGAEGLQLLDDDFAVSSDEGDPQGILVRSAQVDTDAFRSWPWRGRAPASTT
jgi:D-3-phosphoglycerate dehydrogenase